MNEKKKRKNWQFESKVISLISSLVVGGVRNININFRNLRRAPPRPRVALENI